MKPEWKDGLPTNLEAAATDALVWLEIAVRCLKLTDENRARLTACIAALEKELNRGDH